MVCWPVFMGGNGRETRNAVSLHEQLLYHEMDSSGVIKMGIDEALGRLVWPR